MTGKAIAAAIAAVVGVMVCCVAGLGIGASGIALAACTQPQASAPPAPDPSASGTTTEPTVAGWDAEQISNAATIAQVGAQLNVPPRGWVIAVATAMQESSLRNLGNQGSANDHDSLGLFQQRPSQGWGTPAQILNPVYAATQFYSHLLDVSGWQDLPLTVAAQDVQKSAYPDAYAKWEDDAVAVVDAVGPGATGLDSSDFTDLDRHVRRPRRRRTTRQQLPTPAERVRPAVQHATSRRHCPQLGPRPARHPVLLRRRLHQSPRRQPRPRMRLLQSRPAGVRARRHHPAPHHLATSPLRRRRRPQRHPAPR